ncbi:hypothetical protein QN277_024581 [Acacia crassicarpa]|uniref:Glycosyltransferase n=1 Tax=Acacia crassicarpa TaxID=499986 RepID=A0AAE1JG98_9FABA|nr:hypothetical protein QN277_024581 [Acacia crassicarpa]
MAKTTHIAVIPSPGFSHLVPIIEFSKRLIHLHPDFQVHCIIPSLGSPSSTSISYLQTLPSNINPIFLPPVPHNNMPQENNNHTGFQIQRTVTLSLPHIREELESLMSSRSNNKLAALIVDVFAMEVLDIASELNILSHVDLQDPIEIPGCVPVHGRDLPDSLQDRSSEVYKQFLGRSRRIGFADGVLVNSFTELEAQTIKALEEEAKEKQKKPRIYPVGPILHSGSAGDENRTGCVNWLNKQQPRSVLYVSFGSGGTLSQEQLNELAFGLELSGERFLWVVRPPSNNPSAAYLDNSNEQNPLDFLPEGFLERTKEKGFVIPSWAPQIQILSHSSTGGFLSHCGWNSVLESVQKGVPLMAWPLFAEQRINAVLLTDGMKVALRPKGDESGIVGREEIAELVKSLMKGEEGNEIRKRMSVLRDASANALKEEDGSSTETLLQLALQWKDLGGKI